MSPSKPAIPESFTLRVGEARHLHLPSLGTSGYLWFAEADGSSVEISRTRGSGPGMAPGASTDEIVIVKAVATGEVALLLDQRRPWEHNDGAREQVRVQITVLP